MHIFQTLATGIAFDFLQVLGDRVASKVQPQRFPFTVQHNLLLPEGHVGVGLLHLLRRFGQYAKHVHLADRFGFGMLIGRFQRIG
ncbi:hypothetical protein D3C78_1100630 [compost metagenome]